MRKLMFLMLVLSGLSLVACGSDGDDKGNAGDGDGDNAGDGDGDGDGDDEMTTDPIGDGSDGETDGDTDGIDIPEDDGSTGDDGEVEVKYPECPREMIPGNYPGYEGEKPFTAADLTACQQMCGQTESCYTEMNCPGLDKFNECFSAEVVSCSVSTQDAAGNDVTTPPACRVQFENFICCVNINMCGETDDACVMNKCGEDLTAVQGCLMADTACGQNQTLLQACLGTDDTTTPTDPGTGTGTGGTTIPAQNLKSLLHSLQSIRVSQ
jgi:hypothetical protein